MQARPWHLTGHTARLSLEELVATVDLARPEAGLLDVRYLDTPVESSGMMRVTPPNEAYHLKLVDAYLRGGDLIATYTDTEQRGVRSQVYWRGVSSPSTGRVAVGFELMLSVQTSRLDSDPRLTTVSHVPADEAWQLVDERAERFARLNPTVGESICKGSPDGKGLFVFQMPGHEVNYAQMVHPADFGGVELAADDSSTGAMRLSCPLFIGRLEKGVICRARLRGLFVGHAEARQTAADCYRQLIEAAPPLTS